ncbi:N utilization substance protein B [Clostridium polyendosporum]|uniref:Transcription antitermination protein NusB n=1 Tax=Clostridium polyendosporum TaxID=69208 RepID=A0A919VFW7_9CLOT|nr:transcription antitermination factor NusB [Clostridium polyendosporum]GIM27946.1 N utilization substance protein B [Clostridium polyendosporum]
MNRVKSREVAVQLSYQMLMNKESAEEVIQSLIENYEEDLNELDLEYIKRIITGIDEKKDELDATIEKYLVNWKFNRIPKVNISILRMAIFEMLYMNDIPEKVSINEAIELAKIFSDEKSVSFINGILDKILKSN